MGTQFILGEVVSRANAAQCAELTAKFNLAAPDSGVLTRSFDGHLLVGFHVGWTQDGGVVPPADRHGVLPRWLALRTFLKENGLDPGNGRDMTFDCASEDQIPALGTETPA